MGRTIGRRWPNDAPRGSFTGNCAYCGASWRRDELRRDEAGLLACPDEGKGLPSVALDRANLERTPPRKVYPPVDDADRNKPE